jgi:hypothetical protein
MNMDATCTSVMSPTTNRMDDGVGKMLALIIVAI